MNTTTQNTDHISTKRIGALRSNALAALVMLVLEFGLGVVVNLYATLPKSDSGATFLSALAAAIGNGPLSLSIHAVLGTLLLVTGIICIVRAALTRISSALTFSIIGLVGILAAWGSGVGFIGTQDDSASLAMAIATAVALLSYALIVFLVPGLRNDSEFGASDHNRAGL
jgi:hypothetical protein